MIDEGNILKYLQGKSSPEETAAILAWLELKEENKIELETYRMIWEEAGHSGDIRIPDVNLAWENLDIELFRSHSKHNVSRLPILAAAASILIILTLTLYIFYPRERFIHHVAGNIPEEIQLDDGSVRTLSPGAHIYYPESFTNYPTRKIEVITGDIQIEVTTDDTKPFRVDLYPAGITVKGTIFKAQTDSLTAVVENIQGLIRFFDLQDESRGQDVQEGQVLQFDGSEFTDITPAPTPTPPPPTPPPGKLLSVNQIIDILQWRYPVRTEIIPYMRIYPGRIRLDTGQNLEGMVQQLDTTAEVTYHRKGNRYIFSSIRPLTQ